MMKLNHPLFRMPALLLAVAVSCAVHAQPVPVASPAPPMAVEPAAGEVRKVDRANGKITLKHGEIKNLGMPPMAMVFDVRDAALIGGLKAGDKVRFKAVHEGGKYVVTEIRRAK